MTLHCADLFGTAYLPEFSVAALIMIAGLLALVLPLRWLGLARRPWLLVTVMIPTGLLYLAQGLAGACALDGVAVAAIVIVELAWFGGLAVAWRWLRRGMGRRRALYRASDRLLLADPNLQFELRSELAAGNRMEAVRRVCEVTGMHARQAKLYVDTLAAH